MINATSPPAADPHSSLRPRRYGIAIAIAAAVVVALIASSILNYVFLDTIPGRTSLYGLLAVALITLGTYILVRAFNRDRAARRNHLIRAAVLIGIGRADAVLQLPAIQIPRAERRILGSAYGSVRPERDFPVILQLYASGRLPLDRLISHRLPLQSAQQALDLVRDGSAVRAVLTPPPSP